MENLLKEINIIKNENEIAELCRSLKREEQYVIRFVEENYPNSVIKLAEDIYRDTYLKFWETILESVDEESKCKLLKRIDKICKEEN